MNLHNNTTKRKIGKPCSTFWNLSRWEKLSLITTTFEENGPLSPFLVVVVVLIIFVKVTLVLVVVVLAKPKRIELVWHVRKLLGRHQWSATCFSFMPQLLLQQNCCVVSIINMQCSSGSNHRIFVEKQVLILFVIGKHMASPLGDSFPFRPPLAESANVSGGVKVPFVWIRYMYCLVVQGAASVPSLPVTPGGFPVGGQGLEFVGELEIWTNL